MNFRGLIDRLRGGEDPSDTPPAPRREARTLTNQFLKTYRDKNLTRHPTVGSFPLTAEIKDAPAETQRAVLMEASRRLRRCRDIGERWRLVGLFMQLVRRKLDFTSEELCELIDLRLQTTRYSLPTASIIGRAEDYIARHGATPELAAALRRMRDKYDHPEALAETKKRLARIKAALGESKRELFDPHDAWAKLALESLDSFDEEQRRAWDALLQHAAAAKSSKPSKKWATTAGELIEPIGFTTLHGHFARWVTGVGKPGNRPFPAGWPESQKLPLDDRNADILRGLVWFFAGMSEGEYARTIGDLAERCLKKIPDVGALSAKVGNACLYTLSTMEGTDAVAQLSRLKTKAKKPSVRKLIDKSLDAASERAGVSTEELEESATPDFRLGADGVRRETLGEHTAELAIVANGGTELTFVNARGKRLKSVPKAVKDNHADALKALRQAAKDIQKTLGTVRHRLERAPLLERTWDLKTWRQRFIDHPLSGTLGRRLIWGFKSPGRDATLAAWHDRRLIDVTDAPCTPPDDATVRLWHPVGSSVETVRAWRDWLERHRVTQPFKQAHREVYILTDAERQTESYSNRFAAHILKQHQLNALAEQRGWTTGIVGGFDSENTPTLALPHWKLTAEFWVEGCFDGDESMTPAGILLYVATDQVRFRDEFRAPVPLVDVPAIVFSEVMRDVDLFVGVASIGADPAWQDQGDRRYDRYWREYSFGDLSQSAATRRGVLERLLPRLKIADQCEIHERFLRVRGQLRTYKIHLGSGNILMEPNDQYLCIVPGRSPGKGQHVYLPFEGDSTLAVILSKAFLLADDKKIADRTITTQLRMK